MNRPALTRLHAAAAVLALLATSTFLASTLVVELTGDALAVAAVKRFIAYGLLALVPAMAAAGITGNVLAGRSQARAVLAKRRRTTIAAANGLLVLAPCAVALHILASAGSFGTLFYALQAVELVAGPVNVTLLALNARDGMRMSGRIAKPKARG